MINQQELRRLLNYDPVSGVFFWRVKPSHSWKSEGDEAGSRVDGYIQVRINGQLYKAHQLAFMYVLGYFPDRIDHRDRNGFNNGWLNLREATHQQNITNSRMYSNNTSGFKGVIFHKTSGLWTARIRHYYRSTSLGYYKTAEEAAEVRQLAADLIHGDFQGDQRGV